MKVVLSWLREFCPTDLPAETVAEALTARWGLHEGTTHVWFEMDLDATPDEDAGPVLGAEERPSELPPA